MCASAGADSPVPSSSKGFFVYILRCADDSLCVGHTTDIEDRVGAHSEGRGALWTACGRPIVLVYHESHPYSADAIDRERQLKRWTHADKLALIDGAGRFKAEPVLSLASWLTFELFSIGLFGPSLRLGLRIRPGGRQGSRGPSVRISFRVRRNACGSATRHPCAGCGSSPLRAGF